MTARSSEATGLTGFVDRQSSVWLNPVVAMVILTISALVVRSIGLNDGLWYDEIRTLVESVRSPMWKIVTVFPGDNQHTFFSVLAHASISAFGEHPWSLRLPAMLFGVATVPMLYVFAREVATRAEAMLTCLLLTVSYHHIWFSQSARGYAMLAFLTLLSSWLLIRGLRSGLARYFVWYAVVAALGIYTHVTMVFLVAAHALICVLPLGVPVLGRSWWESWRIPSLGFVLSAGLAVALYVPVLFEVRQAVVEQPMPMRSATPSWALGELLRGLQIGLGGVLAAAAGVALFATGVWSYFRQSRFVAGMFLVPGMLTLAAAVLLQRPVRPRFVVFLAGFGALIVVRGAMTLGAGIQRIILRRTAGEGKATALGLFLVLVLAAMSAVSLQDLYRHPKQDFIGAMRFLDANAAAGEPILTAGPATYPYTVYFARPWPAVRQPAQLQAALAGARHVWVVYTLKSYLDPDLLRVLDEQCEVAARFAGTVGAGEVTVCRMSAK